MLQAPQLFSSLETSTHCWPQQVCPAWQACVGLQPGRHVSLMQMEPAGQASSLTHPTQRCVLRSQTSGTPFCEGQSTSPVQPAWH